MGGCDERPEVAPYFVTTPLLGREPSANLLGLERKDNAEFERPVMLAPWYPDTPNADEIRATRQEAVWDVIDAARSLIDVSRAPDRVLEQYEVVLIAKFDQGTS